MVLETPRLAPDAYPPPETRWELVAVLSELRFLEGFLTSVQAAKVKAELAAKGIKERLGRHRWVVERTFAWLNRFRRLAIRYERRDDIHQAFLDLGCALICWNFLKA